MRIYIVYIVICLFIAPHELHADKAQKLNKNGVELYKNRKHEESARAFTEALVERPDSPELKFNRGTALSAVGKKEEAVAELENAAEAFKNKKFSAAGHFNAGNTYFNAGDLNNAIQEYMRAVKLDQSSQDIRHNLELALRKLQEQQKQQQQQQQNNTNQNKDNKNQNQQNKQNQDENQNKNDKDKKTENKNNDQEKKQDKQDQQQQQQPQQNPQEKNQQQMTPEEAKRILDAINNEEKKAFSVLKSKALNTVRQGDDW
jgi:tetratricopeptide (TPR) repeat protein